VSLDPKLTPALPDIAPGSVWLVGVGPGDPGLLTLLALHALHTADIVVYDALVDTAILDLVRPGTELVYAGKRGGRPSHDQRDISERLVEMAAEGNRVVRLKGGDPYVFGRGGEEAQALARAGVPFRIVPGITSGIGGLAYAGIPLTHRDTNASVAFVTGHGADGETPHGVDWDALARGAQTLVVYMPVGHLAEIAARLVAAGRAADEPVALVERATTPEQRVVQSTLGRIAADAQHFGVNPPSLLVVGGNAALARSLGWFAPDRLVGGAG
jgi:uroporphyrin-III C-methyltransferase